MVDKSKFVNHFEIDDTSQKTIEDGWGRYPTRELLNIPHTEYDVASITNLLTPHISALLRRQLKENHWLAVGLDGRADHTYSEVGNYRLSNWNPGLANRLWERLAGFFPDYMLCDALSPTDHDGHERWRPVGVSPLFRYIRYAEGGQLVAHYDETFIQDSNHRTLMSLVIYLTDNERGVTRFVNDDQVGADMSAYDFSDWDRAARLEEVALRVPPRECNALMFPHRILHDSEPLGDGDPEKIIIRTDIMFERA